MAKFTERQEYMGEMAIPRAETHESERDYLVDACAAWFNFLKSVANGLVEERAGEILQNELNRLLNEKNNASGKAKKQEGDSTIAALLVKVGANGFDKKTALKELAKYGAGKLDAEDIEALIKSYGLKMRETMFDYGEQGLAPTKRKSIWKRRIIPATVLLLALGAQGVVFKSLAEKTPADQTGRLREKNQIKVDSLMATKISEMTGIENVEGVIGQFFSVLETAQNGETRQADFAVVKVMENLVGNLVKMIGDEPRESTKTSAESVVVNGQAGDLSARKLIKNINDLLMDIPETAVVNLSKADQATVISIKTTVERCLAR